MKRIPFLLLSLILGCRSATSPQNGTGSSFSYVIVGTKPSGIFWSNDQGDSWHAGTGISSPGYISAVAATPTAIFALDHHLGLFRSTDNGQSWIRTSLTDSTGDALAVFGSQILVGFDSLQYVAISNDSGISWTTSKLPGAQGGACATCFAKIGSKLFAGTNGILQFSTDNGVTWNFNPGLSYEIYALAVGGGILYASEYGNGVMQSKDTGATWTPCSNGLTNNFELTIAGNGPYLYAGGMRDGLCRSTNGGQSWILTDSLTGDIYSVITNGSYVYVGGASYFYSSFIDRSTDFGQTWAHLPLGPLGLQAKVVCIK